MTTLRKEPTMAPMAVAKVARRAGTPGMLMENFEFRISNEEFRSGALLHTPFEIRNSKFFTLSPTFPLALPVPGGEWGLVAPAVFKTVVSARKRRRVGSIPTRLRHATAPAHR